MTGEIHIGRHGIRLLPDNDCVWLIHGDTRLRFSFAEYKGGRGAMRAAIREAEQRNEVAEALNVAEGIHE